MEFSVPRFAHLDENFLARRFSDGTKFRVQSPQHDVTMSHKAYKATCLPIPDCFCLHISLLAITNVVLLYERFCSLPCLTTCQWQLLL